MKKLIAWLLVLVCVLPVLCGCGGDESGTKPEGFMTRPDIGQIRSICSLATLECYYHNVAKAVKPAESGITHIGEKDRTFWIEYTGIAKIGVELAEVTMQMEKEKIVITMPDAKLISINVDKSTFNEDSFVISEDGWNKNKITSEDQTLALKAAQENMKNEAENDRMLLLTAQSRAMKLIEKYIEQLGILSGTDYQVVWVTSSGKTTTPDVSDITDHSEGET